MGKRILALGVLLVASAAIALDDQGWPREIKTGRGSLLIYQPQIDRFNGNIVEGRAAVSFTATGTSEPLFGAFWFKALLETDHDTRMATLLSIQVPRVKFANATEEQQKEVGAFLEEQIPKLDIPISIDRLAAAMEDVSQESRGAGNFRHDPPRIVVSYEPAVLLMYDGTPILQDVGGQEGVYQRVVNTPLPVVRDVKATKFYLCGGDIWYVSSNALGPWSVTGDVPAPLMAMKAEADEQQQQQEPQQGDADTAAEPKQPPASDKAPKIVVATEPTELLVIHGQANWAPITDTELLYVSNSENDIFKDLNTQKTYTALSGRWFSAPSLDGPWTFVPPDSLPRDFSSIPEDSPIGNVLASVPGTDAARDAMLDAQIPQTAAIKRDAVTLEVKYDGAPQFKAIEGTGMEFAVNTSYSVIKSGARYYCCHQAVWYVAGTPQGPWQVADNVPDEIYTIPPANQNYNVTYVHVYGATPTVVYTGYYPGYVNSYIYGGCIVYGTGWYYPPYVSPYFYYPWHPTWGVSVGWNPWTGWGVGVSWGSGPFRVTVGFGGWGGYGGWYGPPGYHPPYHPYPPRPGMPPGYRPPYHPYPPGPGAPPAYRPGGPKPTPYNSNLYARQQNLERNAAVPRDKGVRPANTVAKGGANNMYADRDGNVYRRGNDGTWQQRDKGGWSKPAASSGSYPASGGGSGVSTRPSTGGSRPAGRPQVSQGPSGLERDYQARQRGSSRTQSFGAARSGATRSFGGGGHRR